MTRRVGDERYEQAALQEVAVWPGVSVEFKRTSKHAVCIVTFAGRSRKLVYPSSGSDAKGALNHRQDIRAALRDLGAERELRRKSTAPKPQTKRKAKAPVIVRAQPSPSAPREDRWQCRLEAIAKEMEEGRAVPIIRTIPRAGFWRRLADRLSFWHRASMTPTHIGEER